MDVIKKYANNKTYWVVGAALWGFAEATLFFVVPDLLLTAAVLAFGFGVAIRFAGVCAAGAVFGGVAMWGWGVGDVGAAREALLAVPLIGPDLLQRVQTEILGAWPVNLTIGAVTGAPYKIYAVEAGAAGVNPVMFAAVSFLARYLRFALIIGLVSIGVRVLHHFGADRLAALGLALAWVVIYAVYAVIRLGA